jgi:hypothetical protein
MINSFQINGTQAAELISEDLLIADVASGAQLLVDLYYQHFDIIIFHEKNINPDFFELRTGMAGELLQKASNSGLRLAFIGNFEAYSSKSLRDFIGESNRYGKILFMSSVEEVIKRFEGK